MGVKLTMDAASKKIKDERGRKAIKKYNKFFSADEVFLFMSGETLVIYNTDSIYLYNRDESHFFDRQMDNDFLTEPNLDSLNNIAEQSNKLILYLNLNNNCLVYTLKSLDMLDKKISHLQSRSDFDEKKIFKPLLAYIGAVIINEYPGARWEFANPSTEVDRNEKQLVIKMPNEKIINLPQMLKSLFINHELKRYAIISKVEMAILQAK